MTLLLQNYQSFEINISQQLKGNMSENVVSRKTNYSLDYYISNMNKHDVLFLFSKLTLHFFLMRLMWNSLKFKNLMSLHFIKLERPLQFLNCYGLSLESDVSAMYQKNETFTMKKYTLFPMSNP